MKEIPCPSSSDFPHSKIKLEEAEDKMQFQMKMRKMKSGLKKIQAIRTS